MPLPSNYFAMHYSKSVQLNWSPKVWARLFFRYSRKIPNFYQNFQNQVRDLRSSFAGGIYGLESYTKTVSRKNNISVTYRIRNIWNLEFQTKTRKVDQTILRQLKLDLINSKVCTNNEYGTVGILLQGPIIRENRFTEQVILRYLALFSEAKVVLSTWSDEEISLPIEILNHQNFHLVKVAKPKFPGLSNINLQIASTKSGLNKMEVLDVKFVAKTRTDQCLFNPRAIDLLLTAYSLHCKDLEPDKIIGLSSNTFLFRNYSFSDMFQFSSLKTIIDYWSCPYDQRLVGDLNPYPESTMRHSGLLRIAETYLVTNYMKLNGIDPDNSFKQSLEIYRDLFCILDSSAVELIWNKYSQNENMWRISTFPDKFYEISYWDWCQLQQSLEPFLPLEYVMDM